MLKKYMLLALAALGLRQNDLVLSTMVEADPILPVPPLLTAEEEKFSSVKLPTPDFYSHLAAGTRSDVSVQEASQAVHFVPTLTQPNQCPLPYSFLTQDFLKRTQDGFAIETREGRVFIITGKVLADGTGDLDHLLNVLRDLMKNSANDYFTCHIQWESVLISEKADPASKEQYQQHYAEEIRRLKILVEKLHYHKFIGGKKEDYMSIDPSEIIDKINQNANGVVVIHDHHIDENKHPLPPKIDGWIVVSVFPVTFSSLRKAPSSSVISLLEQQGVRTTLVQPPRRASLGFANQHNGKKGVGIFLEDTPPSSEADRALYLSEIKHTQFHTLLHGEDALAQADAVAYVKNTIFVPWYIKPANAGLSFFRNAYTGMLGAQDARNVCVRGKMPIPGAEDYAWLAQLGFNEIRYLNETGHVSKVAISNALGEKALILFGSYMEEADYRLFNELATVFAGCAGDNSFQHALSKGIVPLMTYAPKEFYKALGITELYPALQNAENAGEITIHPTVTRFLSLYADAPYSTGEKLATTTHNSAGEAIYSPLLLDPWKDVCAYLRKNYNTYDNLRHFVSQYKWLLAHPSELLAEERGYQISLLKEQIKDLNRQNPSLFLDDIKRLKQRLASLISENSAEKEEKKEEDIAASSFSRN